jgi:hypothetical protein
MATLVADCPRCRASEHTFDVRSHVKRPPNDHGAAPWCRRAEVFAECRNCHRPTVFLVEVKDYERSGSFTKTEYWTSVNSLNSIFRILRYISLRDNTARTPPEHVPAVISEVFVEGATCLAIGCFNAAGTMFRLCLDLATKDLLPAPPGEADNAEPGAPNRKQRRDLGLRIPWLIGAGLLPRELGAIADVVKEDGNDGAHAGTLAKEDAEDLADFTEVLLERLYTEPARIELAKARRLERRAAKE